MGCITAVSATVNGSAQTLLSSRSYRADGVPLGQTFGNSLAETRTYNGKGELTAQTFGSADSRTYTYDDNGNLVTLLSTPLDAGYTFDALNRLTEDDITSTPTSTINYTYDGNGNRTSDGGSYTYTTNTNRLTQTPSATITLDNAGNTTGDGTYTYSYSYNNDGHLYQVLDGANVVATYTYNHLRQRTRKVVGSATTVYHYDLAGNLISETQDDATLIRDYIWLDGAPIAQIDYNGTTDTVTYLHADYLNTPRLGTDGSQNVVWSWEGNAFGDSAPTGTVTVNLRFPGQYFDAETGFHYNWNRYYDSATGRYITSDPIGLWGGLNTYGYVYQNPIRYIDPFGLFEARVSDGGGRNGATYGGYMTITGNNGQSTTVRASTWPKPSSLNPGVKEGNYNAIYKQKGHKGQTDGIRIRDGLEVPTIAPNPNNNNQSTATGINVHCGYSETNRGSQGCITIHPDDCDKVWGVLEEGETGNFSVARPSHENSSCPICDLF